ncbi:MAG: hypothetical protein KAJ19_09865 [Gammaproteobacteria bacterium]|nr:hypothetical protein [Gammaproteobacteria bacterium]
MNEREAAIAKAREIEDRVRQLYFKSVESDAGLVALKLIFPSIDLPERGALYYRGRLGAAIARAVVPGSITTDWCVWLKRKKATKGNFMFKLQWYAGYKVSHDKDIPWSWTPKHYFVYSNVEELPF